MPAGPGVVIDDSLIVSISLAQRRSNPPTLGPLSHGFVNSVLGSRQSSFIESGARMPAIVARLLLLAETHPARSFPCA